MSKTTVVEQANITNIGFIQQAVRAINNGLEHKITIVENQKPRMYFSGQGEVCDYVLILPGKYDVGLKKNQKGTYDLVFDSHGNHVYSVLGSSHGKSQLKHVLNLVQEYQKAAVLAQAAAQGLPIESVSYDKNGNLHILASIY